MLGGGIGSGVYELEPPRERDELPPVIFLNAPETFRPMPFMMEQKHVQLETGYVSETELNVLTRELLLLSCSKEMREWGLLKSNLEQKSNENPRAKFERVWEGVSEWELSVRAQHPLLGLYLKSRSTGTTARRWIWKLGCLPKLYLERRSKLFFKGFSYSEIFLDFCER